MNVLTLRKSLNKTQEEVAIDLKLTRATYANYEAGKTQPDLEILIKMADLFSVSLDYLCGRQYNNNIGYIPDERKDLIKKIILLDEKSFEKTEGYVSALLDN